MRYQFHKKAGDKFFNLNDGKPLHSIKELYQHMDSISDDVFSHHVTPERNDFSSWILHVFDEQGLAEKVADAKTKKEMKQVLGEWIYQVIHEKHRQEIAEKETKEVKKSKVRKGESWKEQEPQEELQQPQERKWEEQHDEQQEERQEEKLIEFNPEPAEPIRNQGEENSIVEDQSSDQPGENIPLDHHDTKKELIVRAVITFLLGFMVGAVAFFLVASPYYPESI